MRQAAGNGRAREATRRQDAERSGDRSIQGGAGHAEVYRPTVRRGERLVNRLHLKVLHLASAVEARGRGGDRPPQGVARRMAKITLATIAAGHDVAERVDDDTDPALGCACPPKDLLNGARRDADRQNKASPPTAYDRNGDRDEALAADGTEGADLANGRAFRPQRLLEAAAIVNRSERLAKRMHGVEQLSARGIGKRNRLHERPTLEDSLRFRPEQLEIGLIERWQSRKRRRGLDSLAEFGRDPLGDARQRVGSRAPRSGTRLIRSYVGDRGAEQQHRNGRRQDQRDKQPTRTRHRQGRLPWPRRRQRRLRGTWAMLIGRASKKHVGATSSVP